METPEEKRELDIETPLPTTEQPQEQSAQEQPLAAETQTEEQQSAATEKDSQPQSKNDLLQRLGELAEQSAIEVKSEIESLKLRFYRKHNQEIEEAKQLWQEAGNELQDFIPTADEVEEKFKELFGNFRKKYAAALATIEAEKERNLQLKEDILEKFRQLTDNIGNIGEAFPKVRELQQQWKEIGMIPQTAVADTWKRFQLYAEKFYDYVNINNELRDYDFKKNLEIKTRLLETAEKLAGEKDTIAAFRQLQLLHEEWRESGPVAKEIREEIWEKFKAASTVINKRHQQHFDELHAKEEESLQAKTALCEEIDLINTELAELKTYKDWDAKTAQVLELQERWKKTGFAPRNVNQKIFDRFRTACTVFFTAKNEHYTAGKAALTENLAKKTALCEKAEAAKDSTDWKETSDLFIALQKEWKTIGTVPRKQSDSIWKRFIDACDYFFDRKTQEASGERQEQDANLEAKRAIIQKVKALTTSENAADASQELKSLIAEFNSVGHVPYKNKEKIYKDFHEAVDKQFDQLNVDSANRRLDSYKSRVVEAAAASPDKMKDEQKKLKNQLTQLNSEIQTSENNMLFFFSKSNKQSTLKDEMLRKVEKMKEEREILKKKIEMLKQEAQ
jgi:hypothetical protein